MKKTLYRPIYWLITLIVVVVIITQPLRLVVPAIILYMVASILKDIFG